MSLALRAFRAVDFNWTHDLQSIWSDPEFQVDELHRALIDQIIENFLSRTKNKNANPIGQVLLGEAGAGKTHLLGTLRKRVWRANGWFVLLDIIGITEFWPTAAQAFLDSLNRPMPSGESQYQAVLSAIANAKLVNASARTLAIEWAKRPDKADLDTIDLFLKILRRIDPVKTLEHQDVVRALLLLGSSDLDASNLAYCWLQGLDVDEAKLKELRFLRSPPQHIQLVRGMLWIMSLAGPTLIAVDQIDSIVSASNIVAGLDGAEGGDTERRARVIIEILAGGLMELHELKSRAMTVVSCLQVTWPIIKERSVQSAAQRFEELPVLEPIKSRDIIESLITGRLNLAYKEEKFRPPYPSWPFPPEAIESAIGLLPRQVLIRCQEHRQRCIAAGAVSECESLAKTVSPLITAPKTGIGEEFSRSRETAAIPDLLDKENEHAQAWELLVRSCELLLRQLTLPESIDAIVKSDTDRKKPSLHARVSFTFHNEADREQHYCFRILGHTNAIAFQSRLKAAMTASGLDRSLKFRRLFILRRGGVPSGPKTKVLVEQFLNAGGQIIAPTDDDLRRMVGLCELERRDPPGFDAWLLSEQPLFKTHLFQEAGLCPPSFLSSAALTPASDSAVDKMKVSGNCAGKEIGDGRAKSVESLKEDRRGNHAENLGQAGIARDIPIGRRFEHGSLGDRVSLSVDLLPRHIAILAGSGSGKTVLLRRLVEEAALLGIPSVVLDINNDLSRLGCRWPTRPDGFCDEDAEEAGLYFSRSEVVIWTPGSSSGNPISLRLLPDFAAIGAASDAQTEDERVQAIEMARATLSPFLAGGGQKAALKQGVLADALRTFAKGGGGSLDDLIDLLSELPENVSKIGNAAKLGGEIANQLLAAVSMNPLLQATGSSLDPKCLFHGSERKARISVINLAALGSDDARHAFVNQLQMTLFTWVKQNPSPTGRLYVLDEAQNFVPSQAGTACKRSGLSLIAQARKYGLGMIFATQLPKGIDNGIISNCTTHIYGRMSSPATIQATQELMAAKGGAAADIARLAKGEFYFSTEGCVRPLKIRTPLCLSWHPANPPTSEEVVRMAQKHRP